MSEPVDRVGQDALQSEWVDQLVSCLAREGIPATRTEEGFGVGEGVSQDALVRADESCRENLGPQPEPPPLSEAELRGLYRLHVEAKQCLEGLGEEISEPPSEEVWIDEYRSGLPPWSPFLDVADVASVEGRCPQPDLADL